MYQLGNQKGAQLGSVVGKTHIAEPTGLGGVAVGERVCVELSREEAALH